MNIYTKEEAKIRYTLRPIPTKARKNNATNTPDAPWRSHQAPTGRQNTDGDEIPGHVPHPPPTPPSRHWRREG